MIGGFLDFCPFGNLCVGLRLVASCGDLFVVDMPSQRVDLLLQDPMVDLATFVANRFSHELPISGRTVVGHPLFQLLVLEVISVTDTNDFAIIAARNIVPTLDLIEPADQATVNRVDVRVATVSIGTSASSMRKRCLSWLLILPIR